MNTTVTKRDLIEKGVDALDMAALATAAVKHESTAGSVSEVNLPQVVEIAKFMSVAGIGVPQHCRGNVGVCLRLTFQAVEWRMSPFSVADMSYVVNERVAYLSQLLHAVVEGRAPLQRRLDCEYLGEGPTRQCRVIGYFTSGDVRDYTTPMFKDIRVKNSPLWKDDVDQQLFYYGSRSWARKWCPDVLLGVYTREELEDRPPFGGEAEAGSGLHARLAGSERSEEGHSHEHARREIDQIAGSGGVIEHVAGEGDKADDGKPAKSKKKGAEAKAPAKPDEAPATPAEPAAPKTAAEYNAYAIAWITASTDIKEMDKRWDSERSMRNNIGLTSEDRQPAQDALVDRREQLAPKE